MIVLVSINVLLKPMLHFKKIFGLHSINNFIINFASQQSFF